ncbi:MAG: NAD(P)/FAD-dependent oxidoreductase [Firmicutes bacterium]|nr:NAD(P)/FAD-dependent oxidoreductase [Bacillota bacterium]MCL2255556.1 NAD(P)/FAD-dependent oxidoreductase [Bacillota bacterium]
MKIAIVGAGPAGLMAASAVKDAKEIVIFDGNEKAGKKLYLTGKGRCNVTNDCTLEEFLENVVTNKRFLYSALSSLSPQEAIVFFEENGAKIKVERGRRAFPKSDKASDITKALMVAAQKNGARLELNSRIKSIEKVGDKFEIDGDATFGTPKIFDKIILATGGISYPATGSDGAIFDVLKKLGHTIVPLKAALVPIILNEDVKSLEGQSLKNVTATISGEDFKESLFGEMLFTANGVSGPIILSLSSLINKHNVENAMLLIDLKPALTNEQLDKRILSDFEKSKNKQIKNILHELVPKGLIDIVLEQSGIKFYSEVNGITKEERVRLVKSIKGLKFGVKRLAPVEAGIVTSGGVSTKEVDSKTMQSKIVSGLYFAGEMLDIDALTGGYNIQIALSTGHLAGKSV